MKNRAWFIDGKYFRYITEAFAGVAIMGIEMSASRFISTYFSSSQIVWTFIIGTIMVSMAIGNYWGGRQADKKPSYKRLYAELLFAGAYVVLVPFLGRYVIAGVTALFALFVTENLVIWASLFCCVILFVPPLLFLGKVTPSLVKYTMGEKASGKVVGTMEALNTVGSIVGTFLPTFLTIPFMGTSKSFVLFGVMLGALGLVYLITSIIRDNGGRAARVKKPHAEVSETENGNSKTAGKRRVKSAVCAAVLGAILVAGSVFSFNASFIFWQDSALIKEDESMYNYLKVDKNGKQYTFSTNVLFGVQSAINEDDSLTGMYYDYLLVAPKLIDKEKPEILVLGNGTGTFGTLVKNYLNLDCNITAVEIDRKIIDLSYEYFHMNEEIDVVCDDGRHYISRTDKKFDIILVDAYSSVSAPFHMTTVEFFNIVKEHLNDGGVMMMNINMTSSAENSVTAALCDTAHAVFSNLITFRVPGGSGTEVFASESGEDLTAKINAAESEDVPLDFVFSRLKNGIKTYENTGIRLYDDTADVELRSIKALDEIVNGELDYYRNILREKGIKGLMDALWN